VTRKISATDLADNLGVSVETVYDRVAAKVIPSLRLRPRGRLWFDEAEVEAALRRAGRPAAGPAAGRPIGTSA
jgi:excisionase family DNA binding protein